MSFDQRVRQGLLNNADRAVAGTDLADVAGRLDQVRLRGRRRQWRRRVALSACMVAVSAATTAIAVAPIPVSSSHRPTTSAAGDRSALVGTWQTIVEPAHGFPDSGVSGAWTLTFYPDGSVVPLAPHAFRGSTEPFAFTVNAGQFLTDAFSNDLCADLPAGRYSFLQAGNRLTFIDVSDRCTARVQLLSGQQWVAVP